MLPLKLWFPRGLDGVALAVGSAAPDFVYVIDGFGVSIRSHAWHSVLWWSVPTTLVISWLIRLGAPTVAAHLPSGGRFALRDYGTIGTHRYSVRVSAGCAAIGATSHLCWDSFTHASMDGGTVLFPILDTRVWPGMPLWHALQYVSSLVGVVVVVAMLARIGRYRLLVEWHGEPPLSPRRPALFWTTAAVVCGALISLMPWLPGSTGPHVIGARILVGIMAGALAGSAAVRLAGGGVDATGVTAGNEGGNA